MAKKFGKILLFSAAIGSAAAALYYYLLKKDAARNDIEEDDYDDFSDDLEDESESSPNYVPLNSAPENEQESSEETFEDDEASQETFVDDSSAEDVSSETETSSEVETFVEDTWDTSAAAPVQSEDAFTPLTEQVAQAADNAEGIVEDFFDEEDAPDVEPPVNDN